MSKSCFISNAAQRAKAVRKATAELSADFPEYADTASMCAYLAEQVGMEADESCVEKETMQLLQAAQAALLQAAKACAAVQKRAEAGML